MMKFKYLLLSLLFLPTAVWAVSANVASLKFTTDPYSLDPGALSGTITVQTQNSSGECEKVDETTDLVFTSSSATGEFLSTSGSAVQKYMASGSCNKNFAYRDATAGTYTLAVRATGKVSGLSWSATQAITVRTPTPTPAPAPQADPAPEPTPAPAPAPTYSSPTPTSEPSPSPAPAPVPAITTTTTSVPGPTARELELERTVATLQARVATLEKQLAEKSHIETPKVKAGIVPEDNVASVAETIEIPRKEGFWRRFWNWLRGK